MRCGRRDTLTFFGAESFDNGQFFDDFASFGQEKWLHSSRLFFILWISIQMPDRRSIMRAVFIALLSFYLLSFAACSKSESSSMSIPDTLPIVQATIPSTLYSSSVSLLSLITSIDSNLDAVKTRLFSPGPTDFQYRLSAIDSRLNELESRLGDCANEEAKSWTVPVGDTGIPLTTMYFQCYTSVTGPGVSDYKIYLGKKDSYWYLAELQINDSFESSDAEPPTMGVLAKVASDSSTVEAYQISVEKVSGSYYASIVQILADKTTGVFELAVGSDSGANTISPGANFTALGCGVRMKTASSLVYAEGVFSQGASCGSSANVCANTTDFSSDTGCSGAGLTTLSSMNMTQAALATAQAGNAAKAIIVDKTGMPSLTSY
jgi:hypothetical protein